MGTAHHGTGYHYLNALPSAVIAFDREARVQYVNPAAESLLDISAAYLAQHAFSPWLLFNEALRQRVMKVLHSGEAASLYEQRLQPPQRAELAVTLHITPVFTEAASGQPPAIEQALVTVELSARMRSLSEQAVKQEIAHTVGLMSAMLAHEVKNPLAAIRGAAQLLGEEAGAEHRPLAELICLETDRIRDLLAQVDMFEAHPPVLQPVNIHEVLRYAIAVAKAGFGRHVMFVEQYDPSLPEVAGQRDLLVQLFLNLIKNAVEALEETADPTITLSSSYRSQYHARSERRQPVLVSIADNGCGVEAGMRAQLFTPFITSKAEGRGLGLAMVAKIAGDLGASVELDSAEAQGSKFNVMLPLFVA